MRDSDFQTQERELMRSNSRRDCDALLRVGFSPLMMYTLRELTCEHIHHPDDYRDGFAERMREEP